jgi:ABC-2 type transport system permease protein
MSVIRPVLYLVQKEFLQVFRDRAMRAMILGVPLIQLFIFGYAANTDVRNARLSLLDEDHSVESRRIAEAYYATDIFTPGPQASDPAELEKLLVDGRADVTVWIPKGFARDLAQGRQPSVAVAADGQNSNLAGRVSAYANAVLLREGYRMLADRGFARSGPAGNVPIVVPVTRFFYNPEIESRHYMVPGIIVLVITVITTMLTGMSVVREREIGTLEQLLVSAITSGQFIAGKTIPFVLIGFFDLAFATAVGVLWFRIPLVGSVALLAACAMVYLLVTLGIGLFASTLSSTQQQAMLAVWFFLVFGILTSGLFYPVENMPQWVQYLTYVNPLRYMMSIVRNIFLRGATLADIAPQLVPLLALGGLIFGAAVSRTSKHLG